MVALWGSFYICNFLYLQWVCVVIYCWLQSICFLFIHASWYSMIRFDDISLCFRCWQRFYKQGNKQYLPRLWQPHLFWILFISHEYFLHRTTIPASQRSTHRIIVVSYHWQLFVIRLKPRALGAPVNKLRVKLRYVDDVLAKWT